MKTPVLWELERKCPGCGSDNLESNGCRTVEELTWLCLACGRQTGEADFDPTIGDDDD